MPRITVAGVYPRGATGMLYLTKKEKVQALLPDINPNNYVEENLEGDSNHPILIDAEAQAKAVSTSNCKT
jgi:hypothetical protein